MEKTLDTVTLRMLDANCNRAAEGLRTLEDIARFVLNRPDWCSAYKQMRHQLAECLTKVAANEYLRTRDVEGDVGTTITTVSEFHRTTLSEIASAAAARVEQALRCVEECCKLASESIAANIEQLRYSAYSYNARLLMNLQRDADFLAHSRLCVLVDCRIGLHEFEDRVLAISEAGAELIQIRDKIADAQLLLAYADSVTRILDVSKTRLIINDRVDLAAISHAHGVHLGQTDIKISDARKLIPVTTWVGISTHNVDQYAVANQVGADYVGCGPTFPSNTKEFSSFAGLEYLREVAASEACPAFAIGGINITNVGQVTSTGIKRVAVASAIWNAPDPAAATSQIRNQL
jgi:thiamine-phosphate pyrophosphorylase